MPDENLPPIAYSELVERLSDPDSDLDFYLGYLIEVPVPERMGPELEPNPALVTDIPPRPEGGFVVSLANGFMRRRRHRAYRRRIAGGWAGPRIVSEGDSWFQYPTSLQDIIDHLMKDNAILSLGAAGDELKDIQRQREILLNIEAEGAKALLLSAGGNDLFDNGQLGRLVEAPFPGATGEDLVGPTFEAFLRGMVAQYLDLFRRVHRAFPHVHILIHGYGPAFPRDGAWIEKPLTRRGVPKSVQHDVVKVILKRFNETLGQLAGRAEFNGRLAHIDVTDIGTSPGDWHDEIHLDGPNYRKVAKRFQAELNRRLGAAEPESMVFDPAPSAAVDAAVQLAALDQATLLREIDLRVGLVTLDPTAADEPNLPLLTAMRPEPEIGIASIRRATRRLIDPWLENLREVICDGAEPGNFLEHAIVEALDKGKTALAGAVAGWLVTGPLGVPAAVASALAAWLAGEALDAGREAFCAGFRPVAPPMLTGAVETSVPTVGEAREKFRRPDGLPKFDKDYQKEELEFLRELVVKEAVEVPDVPVDAQGVEPFMQWAGKILEMLGGEEAEAPAGDAFFGGAEALVLADGTRPALYVRDGTIDTDDIKLERSGFQDQVKADLPAIERQIRATGRVLQGFDRSADRVFGSAWMLDGGRVATARHVLELMGEQFGPDWFLHGSFFVDFAVEADRPAGGGAMFKVSGVDFAGPTAIRRTVNPVNLDVAVLTLEPVAGQDFPDPVTLAAPEDEAAMLAEETPSFYNVGHPGQPRGSWLVDHEDGNPNTLARSVLFALIGDKFGVKRFSPGMISRKPGIYDAMGGHAGSVLLHDATTLGGSSGSSLMMQGKDGMVTAGLHFAGLFGTRNYAHWVPAIQEPLT